MVYVHVGGICHHGFTCEQRNVKAVGHGKPRADDALGQTVQIGIQTRSHHRPSVRREAPSAFIRVLIPMVSDTTSIP